MRSLDSGYFRFQSNRCLSLAQKERDLGIASELIRMAEEFSELSDKVKVHVNTDQADFELRFRTYAIVAIATAMATIAIMWSLL